MSSLVSLIYKEKWSEIPDRIKEYPEEAQVWENLDDRPLLYACGRTNIPGEVIDAIIQACPQAVKEKSKLGGALPLHIAARQLSNTTPDIVKVLLHHYKEAAVIGNDHGHTPLMSHLVLNETPSLEVVKTLVETKPEAAKITDDFYYYPLHRATDCGIWEIVKCLIDAYPEALRKKTRTEETPRDMCKRRGHDELYDKLCKEEDTIFGVTLSEDVKVEEDEQNNLSDKVKSMGIES